MLDWTDIDDCPELVDFVTGVLMTLEMLTDDQVVDRLGDWTVSADHTQVHDDKWDATYDVEWECGIPMQLHYRRAAS